MRELFGYQRIEARDIVPFMNDIYTNYWNPLQNYFLPSFKLKDKIRMGGEDKESLCATSNSVSPINGLTPLNPRAEGSTCREETGFKPI